jgi:hypothetical protein
LLLTNQRLAFQPTDMGWALQAIALLGGTAMNRGTPWSSRLRDIAKVHDEPSSERMRERGKVVNIELRSGEPQEFFVITDFEDSATRIRNAIA